ncbi:MCP methyltransferase, CheR-type [Desulfobulbus propionicus DSM 2032]|uniref:protein-glutamate O-methyltransferase n=1 Tax=Desulfobulbus propionicus (strain ATCC 33891 / DSM 2032 / VKM B-1956 / 1pr3) TaxID=577650 RepID=A0A7U3YM72_DESPD|nr:protein-glutamate O-methyltransferase CheR [Desulfobulbus propionicus]ADW17972.1 MCP methyltransferase, CheR-type [Desulfobulbus propionicus DSM 2032]
MLKITPEEIKLITKYIYEISGIYLDESKKYLLETRLNTIAEEQGCSSYQDFYQKAKADASKTIERRIIDAISTNETLFFRDSGPFQLLQHKIFPELIDARAPKSPMLKTNLKIWSAASSTGQELYSVAIVLQELLGDMSKYSIKLLGTDISDAAISQASSGKYNKFEIERGLSRDKLTRYFTSIGQTWKVSDHLRAMVNFRKFNLMSPFTSLGKFDVILCRNVAIYFTLEDRKKLFKGFLKIKCSSLRQV